MYSIKKEKPALLTLRIPKSLHKEISEAAAAEGITLNTYAIYVLSKGEVWHNADQKPCQSIRQKQALKKATKKAEIGI